MVPLLQGRAMILAASSPTSFGQQSALRYASSMEDHVVSTTQSAEVYDGLILEV